MHRLVERSSTEKPRVVIVGAGPSGVAIASMLGGVDAEVFLLEQAFPAGHKQSVPGIISETDADLIGIDPGSTEVRPLAGIVQMSLEESTVSGREAMPRTWTIDSHALLAAVKSTLPGKGITIVPKASVSGLLRDGAWVTGVRSEATDRTFPAELVVLADDSDPRLAEQLGLRPDWMPTEIMHLGKERFEAPSELIDERFGNEAVSFRHRASWGSEGFGLVIPGRDSIVMSVAMLLEDEMVHATHIQEYLEEVKKQDPIHRLLDGLTSTIFFTEVVPIGGFDAKPRFHANALLVASDMVGYTHPLNRDGYSANLTMCSAAARSIREAIIKRSFSESTLSAYSTRLGDEVVGPVNAARRADRSLRTRAAWEWASKPGLIPSPGEVTVAGKSATLPARSAAGVLQRMRKLGRGPGIRRHAPGQFDE